MKITAVETLVLEAPLENPWRISTFTLRSLTATLVRIHTDEGVSGLGECIARLGPGVTAQVVHEILAPALLGRDPHDVEGIWDDMYRLMRPRGHSRGFIVEAIAGIDIALWDLRGKAAGRHSAREKRHGPHRYVVWPRASQPRMKPAQHPATD